MRHGGIAGTMQLRHALAPLRARQGGGRQELLHFRIGAAAVGHQADMDRLLRVVPDFVGVQQGEGGAGLLQEFDHREVTGDAARR